MSPFGAWNPEALEELLCVDEAVPACPARAHAVTGPLHGRGGGMVLLRSNKGIRF